jgi:hypothetical protein
MTASQKKNPHAASGNQMAFLGIAAESFSNVHALIARQPSKIVSQCTSPRIIFMAECPSNAQYVFNNPRHKRSHLWDAGDFD